jgi:hypothetical protein
VTDIHRSGPEADVLARFFDTLARIYDWPEWQHTRWWGAWRNMWREIVRVYAWKEYREVGLGDFGEQITRTRDEIFTMHEELTGRRPRAAPSYFVLDDMGEPVACWDLGQWGRWFETATRHLAHTEVLGHNGDPGEFEVHARARVSTVFLGIDHSFFRDMPQLWETMVFLDEGTVDEVDNWQERNFFRDDACHTHQKALAMVRSKFEGKGLKTFTVHLPFPRRESLAPAEFRIGESVGRMMRDFDESVGGRDRD